MPPVITNIAIQALAHDLIPVGIINSVFMIKGIKRTDEYFQIAKDAKECVQECVSEFISFITSEYPFSTILHGKS